MKLQNCRQFKVSRTFINKKTANNFKNSQKCLKPPISLQLEIDLIKVSLVRNQSHLLLRSLCHIALDYSNR